MTNLTSEAKRIIRDKLPEGLAEELIREMEDCPAGIIEETKKEFRTVPALQRSSCSQPISVNGQTKPIPYKAINS